MSQRYFEDVHVDEELPPINRLPAEDRAVEFYGRDNPLTKSFDADAGSRLGLEGSVVPGTLKMAWLTKFVSDWAGTEGQIVSIRAVLRRPDVVGRPLTLAGRVVDTRQEGGRGLVELEVVTVAGREPSVRCNVQVMLPRRLA